MDLVALIFVRETSDPLASLVKKIEKEMDAAAGKTERPMGVYIIFDSNVDGLDKQLIAMAEMQSLHRVSLCIGPPPEDYEVSKEADVTVSIYRLGRRRGEKVTANFALRKGELSDTKASAIAKAFSEALPK